MGKSGNGSGHDGAAQRRPMEALHPACQRMLLEAGFTYDTHARAWFNLQAAQVITFDEVAEQTPEWLADWLSRSQNKV
jgi:hypothetical protein